MRLRLVAGILIALLALFGLGGCKEGETEHPTDAPPSHVDDGAELPEILDGPGMYFDPKTEYLDKLWIDPESNQTLFFTTDTLTLKDGDEIIWEGAWEIVLIDGYFYGAQSATGEPVGDYAYFMTDYFKLPEDSPPYRSYVAAHPADRVSDDEYVLFQYDDE